MLDEPYLALIPKVKHVSLEVVQKAYKIIAPGLLSGDYLIREQAKSWISDYNNLDFTP